MKIEALENIKSHGLVLSDGDIVTVDDEVGEAFCAYGWARDVSGDVPTGDRIVFDATIAVNPGQHIHAGEEVSNG